MTGKQLIFDLTKVTRQMKSVALNVSVLTTLLFRHVVGLHLGAGPMLCILCRPESYHNRSEGYNGQRVAAYRAVDNDGTTAGETEHNKTTNPKTL